MSEAIVHKLPIKHKLNNLSDVLITAPANNEELFYELASLKWKNKALSLLLSGERAMTGDFLLATKNILNVGKLAIGHSLPDVQLHVIKAGLTKIAGIGDAPIISQTDAQVACEYICTGAYAGFLLRSAIDGGKPYVALWNTIDANYWTLVNEGTSFTFKRGNAAGEIYIIAYDQGGVKRVDFLKDVKMGDGNNIILDTTTGTKIGTATTQKLGFFGVTPVVQQAGIVDADGTLADITTKFNSLLAKLEALGLLAVA